MRTALYFSTQGERPQGHQVTSPNMGDGKSTLAANLAVSIAQSGKRVILVDADLRRPRMHKLFGVRPAAAWRSVIAGRRRAGRRRSATTGIPGLSVLPCGPLPPNPAELLTSPRFKELLEELRDQYDFVLVDTPPLLAVTDPCVVAPRVDGVVLTIRISKNGRPAPSAPARSSATLGVNVLGVVVNGVTPARPGRRRLRLRTTTTDYGRLQRRPTSKPTAAITTNRPARASWRTAAAPAGDEASRTPRGRLPESSRRRQQPPGAGGLAVAGLDCWVGGHERWRPRHIWMSAAMVPLVDMHCHLLAGLDDGPRTRRTRWPCAASPPRKACGWRPRRPTRTNAGGVTPETIREADAAARSGLCARRTSR